MLLDGLLDPTLLVMQGTVSLEVGSGAHLGLVGSFTQLPTNVSIVRVPTTKSSNAMLALSVTNAPVTAATSASWVGMTVLLPAAEPPCVTTLLPQSVHDFFYVRIGHLRQLGARKVSSSQLKSPLSSPWPV